jgi:hypothetical protein
MGGERSSRFIVTQAAVLLALAGWPAACSHAPQEPAPVFALPPSQIVGAPAIEGQEPAPPAAPSARRQLRYIAVPPDRKVAGMARAHLILKPTAAAPHRHARKTNVAVRHHSRSGAAAAKAKTNAGAAPPSSGAPPAMIMLDQPASAAPGKPSPNR